MGHQHGFVIPVRWSPKQPYLLASGGSDGTVRLWDVRRGKACLASLDQHNTASREKGGWLTSTNRAHGGVVNGLEFTSDGLHLVTIGHDEKMLVWDLEGGLNTLVPSLIRDGYSCQVSYGPVIRNQHRMEVLPGITPPDTCHKSFVFKYLFQQCRDIVFRVIYWCSCSPYSWDGKKCSRESHLRHWSC